MSSILFSVILSTYLVTSYVLDFDYRYLLPTIRSVISCYNQLRMGDRERRLCLAESGLVWFEVIGRLELLFIFFFFNFCNKTSQNMTDFLLVLANTHILKS